VTGQNGSQGTQYQAPLMLDQVPMRRSCGSIGGCIGCMAVLQKATGSKAQEVISGLAGSHTFLDWRARRDEISRFCVTRARH
jgi:hypothetical protein